MNSTEIARVKRRFDKKRVRHHKPLLMVTREDLRSVRIIGNEVIHLTDLPEGVYEVRIIANPDRSKRRKGTSWVVTLRGKRLIGAAKSYFKSLVRDGVVEFYVEKR